MKKMIAAAMTVLLAAGMGMACPASELVDVSGEETAQTEAQEEKKTIGEKAEDVQILDLTNATGKDITAFAVKLGADKTEFSDNLLLSEDVFADGETRTFFTAVKEREDGADAEDGETDAQTEEPTEAGTQAEESTEAQTGAAQEGEPEAAAKPEKPVMTVRLTFADETEAELSIYDTEEIKAYEIRLEEDLAYLVYERDGQEFSTLEWEKSEREQTETEETGAPEEGIVEYDDYYEDTYPEDTYYDDGSYYEDSADDGAAEENCLQGGLMN